MQFTAGETQTIETAGATLVVKIEDASKSDTVSVRIEAIKSGGEQYTIGQIYEFNRSDIKNGQ